MKAAIPTLASKHKSLFSKKYWLNILHFNNFNSSFDSLTLYDGDSNKANIMGKYCGNLIPPNLYSSSNKAFMHFSSNGYNSPFLAPRIVLGFKLQYHPYSKQTYKHNLLYCFWSFHLIVFFQQQVFKLHFSWKQFTIHVKTLEVYFFSDLAKSNRIFLSLTWQIWGACQGSFMTLTGSLLILRSIWFDGGPCVALWAVQWENVLERKDFKFQKK